MVTTLPTMPADYKGCQYWIDGKPPDTYFFFIDRGNGVPVESNESFDSVVAANFAARGAIDGFTALVDEPAPEPTPEPSPKKSTSRRGAKKAL
jgi:hypothetical protein